ncbi:MAG: pyridoxal-phosphate dependent enzyme [Rickettsiales bacterium]
MFKKYTDCLVQTPLEFSKQLSEKFNNNIFLKLESKQVSSSFKIRGVFNFFQYLVNENILNKTNTTHIATYTTGNHGIAVAYLSKIFKIPSKIYAPVNISKRKIDIINNHCNNSNCELILTNTRQEAENYARQSNNGLFLHPSGSKIAISGIANIMQEIYKQLKQELPYAIFAPCGGGGLLSGLKEGALNIEMQHIADKNQNYKLKNFTTNKTKIKIYGCEPKEANDAYLSKKNNKIYKFQSSPKTIADALCALSLSELSFSYIKQIEDMFLASEEEIQLNYNELQKIYPLEISSAIVLSGLEKWHLANKNIKNKNIILIISGNNN